MTQELITQQSFFSSKKWQLAAAVGIPALYAAGDALHSAVTSGQLVVHGGVPAFLFTLLGLGLREVASHREQLGVTAQLAPPPPADPTVEQAIEILRHTLDQADRAKALAGQLLLPPAPTPASSGESAEPGA